MWVNWSFRTSESEDCKGRRDVRRDKGNSDGSSRKGDLLSVGIGEWRSERVELRFEGWIVRRRSYKSYSKFEGLYVYS